MFKIVRRLRVTLTLKSGIEIEFDCDDLTKNFRGNDLTGLQAARSRNWPFYIRLDDISAIQTRKTGWVIRL
jgi:transcriptional antiterminator Rof (Rho-off)